MKPNKNQSTRQIRSHEASITFIYFATPLRKASKNGCGCFNGRLCYWNCFLQGGKTLRSLPIILQYLYIYIWYHSNDLLILTLFALSSLPAIAILFPFPFCCSSEENITLCHSNHQIRSLHLYPDNLWPGRISHIHGTPFSNSSSNALHPIEIVWPFKRSKADKNMIQKPHSSSNQEIVQRAKKQEKRFLYKFGSLSTEPWLWKPYSALQKFGA